MELCSLFQDLVYSIEIAAHSAGLEHYYLRTYFDTVSVVQRYQECFVPENWIPPHASCAEVEFEIGPLDIARSQMSDRDIVETLGIMLDADEIVDESENLTSITVELDIKFVLSVDSLRMPSEAWNDYCHKVTDRGRLQAGLENLKHRLQRAIGVEDKYPAMRVEARTMLSKSGRLALDEITAHWAVYIGADVEDDLRQAMLEDTMACIHAGLDVLDEFAQEIIEDFKTSTAG